MVKNRRLNPFRAGNLVDGDFFANREKEFQRLLTATSEPANRFIMKGKRRMGKSSLIHRVLRCHEERGGCGFIVDFSKASTGEELISTTLKEAIDSMDKWKPYKTKLADFMKSFSFGPQFTYNDQGFWKVDFSLGFKEKKIQEHEKDFCEVLDQINTMASKTKTHVCVVFDEFQEISLLGKKAEWTMRSTIQKHNHVSYFLLGSNEALINRMVLQKDSALYKMFEVLKLGPIEEDFLSNWINEKIEYAKLKVRDDAGKLCLELVGERTQDRMTLARRAYDIGQGYGYVDKDIVQEAFTELVNEYQDTSLRIWKSLSSIMQKILPVVIENKLGLTTMEALRQMGIRSTGTCSNAIKRLVESDILCENSKTASGYDFDDPFFKEWVRLR